ncbi:MULTISPECIES: LysR family transcriptional regulator [unclassified Pseudomonas]|uniref:LysR family transcriptional regulator n=1 Tax=unclassified Pseudomonas TaxID=196821 RepID=UPI002AC92266|nr:MULTISPECIES: LysR family transcriptional regulator [unclassified Pseudomonas]MEB0043062.1 LysR family transcriptional regulator [Pseudomonas sp. MH10]MEB0080244.1 LysR family transcriptional regulator [Pseudomonas sp. MH10out]MEB0094307.1 LysR family transcriptional regulator [Pseudomonas sp. CCI4.2]MEB0104494.1 LysR family transcriptional regulator [Pseudomonas sp. CCI3.2]MEB0121453.1 LysR family transcriptional regulator [Pseudomonas sp. CCI1.2]
MLFEDLKAFVAVIDHHSLTRAAQALCLTQSAVSRRIQHLEESLDANLFDRTSRPPKATALAHRIYQHAVILLRDAEHLLEVPREGAAPSGPFRLGFTQVVADVVVFDVVMKMKAEFPELEVQLHTHWSSELQQQIHAGSLDAATLMLTSPSRLPEGVTGQFITTLEVLVVQSKRAPLVDSRSDMQALASQPWILNPDGCGYRAALERAIADTGKTIRLSVDTHGTEMQLRMVAAGLGLGLIPRDVLRHSRAVDELTVVEVKSFSLSLDIWLVHPYQLGNLKRAMDILGQTVVDGFVNHQAHTL